MITNRLRYELDRLYLPRPQDRVEADMPSAALIDAEGRVRAMVMELTRPATWEVFSRVWQGVQVELGLPAPAIAVSGIDGLQLWFSLAEPIAVAQAHVFLEGLRRRYLPDIESSRVRLMPAASASTLQQDRHAALVPALQTGSGNWSAFLAPDLVPIFAESPWLDIAPNEEGQATLLRSIGVTTLPAFESACARLEPSRQPQILTIASVASAGKPIANERPTAGAAGAHPEQFLLLVMHDDTVAMALRIKAARALLQYANDHHRKPGG